MARRFGRNLENPERRIENEGQFGQTIDNNSVIVDDVWDKKMDAYDAQRGESKPSKREEFMKTIKFEEQQVDTPLALAYKELDKARQSGSKEDIIKAEDRILDLERREEEAGYNARIAELKEMQALAKKSNDPQEMKRFKQMRKSFVIEMQRDELNYKIKKLQNSQRLAPSRETLQQIVQLRKDLDALEVDEVSK